MKKITKEIYITNIEKKIYLISSILLILTTIININTIIYYPYLLNGLILEINILLYIILIIIFNKKNKQLLYLKDRLLELRINYIITKRIK